MKTGDIVVPIQGEVLASGNKRYKCAVIASVSPFVLVSVEGDMLWSTNINPSYFTVLCQASEEIVNRAIKRWGIEN